MGLDNLTGQLRRFIIARFVYMVMENESKSVGEANMQKM